MKPHDFHGISLAEFEHPWKIPCACAYTHREGCGW